MADPARDITPESAASAAGEALACERFAPDGAPYPAYAAGPGEIAVHVPGPPERWVLLTVNSGRLEDTIAAVMALRAQAPSAQASTHVAEFVRARLESWPPGPLAGPVAARWAGPLWRLFKLNLVQDLARPPERER
jgi:hypothetical protein